jgi:hypothetical protein
MSLRGADMIRANVRIGVIMDCGLGASGRRE